MNGLISIEQIEKKIFIIRGLKVMIDSDLAGLYGVPPKVLNQAVKRNTDRFPTDFMFQLTHEEEQSLRSQFVTLKTGKNARGQHRKYLPYAFTEQGVAMISSVLKSKRAVQVNIEIMRAFVKLRELLAAHQGLAKRLEQLEKKYDGQFKVVFEAIWKMMDMEGKPRKVIGFGIGDKK